MFYVSSFTINLTQGQQAIVDEPDWYELRKYKWCAMWDPGVHSYYAVRRGKCNDGRSRLIYMAREILGLYYGDKRQADHFNHDTLDNRRKNLRTVTNRGNQENLRHQSLYGVGVERRRDCPSNPYFLKVRVDGENKYVGSFATSEEAQEARRKFLEKIK